MPLSQEMRQSCQTGSLHVRTLGSLSLRNVRTVISGSDFIIPSSTYYQSYTHQNEFLVVFEIS